MNTIRTRTTLATLVLLLPLASGCSILGFSSYPVAHVLTDDTKAVLDQTPRNTNVARELAKIPQAAHFLQPGDELLIETVEGEGEVRLPADQQVLADGTIDLGKFGRLVVTGLTLEQAESECQRTIADQSSLLVQINVRLIAPIHRYYVIGEVNSPGAYSLTGHETVLDAIMEAGGLTPRASACNLLLARPTDPCSCRVTLPVCYRAITQLGDTTTNYHLQPGDRIFVSRQSLCEEMFGYLAGGKSCGRCAACQVACRDPEIAGNTHPSFIDSGNQSIRPIKPLGETAPETQVPMPLPQPSNEQDVPFVLDGELDF